MGRAVIVGGGEIGNYSRARSFLKEGDYLVYCDSGLRHEEKLGKADLIVGDFDSFPPGERKYKLPPILSLRIAFTVPLILIVFSTVFTKVLSRVPFSFWKYK